MDIIAPGRTDVSILFALDTAGLTIADMKLGYIRWTEGDGTSFAETLSSALTALATITTAHTDNRAIYLDADATGGNKFILRVDFPDAAFATGDDRVICNIYDDGNSVIAQRVFDLTPDLTGYKDGFVTVSATASNTNTALGIDGTITNPVSTLAAAKTLADQTGKKIELIGSFTNEAIDLTDYIIKSGSRHSILDGDASTGVTLANAKIYNMWIQGDIICDAETKFYNCSLSSVAGVVSGAGLTGIARNCYIINAIELKNIASSLTLDDCFSDSTVLPPEFRFNGTLGRLVVNNFKGAMNVADMTGASHRLEVNGAKQLTIASSCNAGTYVLVDIDYLSDSSTVTTKSILDAEKAYPDGKIWYDSGASNTGTVFGYDGTKTNPVSTIAAAKSLADDLGTRHIMLQSDVALAEDYSVGYIFEGSQAAVECSIDSGATVTACIFRELGITSASVPTSIGDDTYFDQCRINGLSGFAGIFRDCDIFATNVVSATASSSAQLLNCGTFNNQSIFDFTGSNGFLLTTNDWTGALNITNMSHASDKGYINIDGGYFEIDSTCDDGDFVLSGECHLDDGKTGVCTLTDHRTLGNPYDLEDGTTVTSITEMLSQMAETVANGGTFQRSTDALQAIRTIVGNISSGSAAISTIAGSFVKVGAEPETNTYEATHELDGTYHIVEDDGGATNFYYQFSIGGNGVPVEFLWQGYAQGNNDTYDVYAYNYGAADYEQIGTIDGTAGATIQVLTFTMTSAHVGTGANLGMVQFRILSADGTAFATDRILCSYAVVSQSVGYADGAIWINTGASNTNTEVYVDGTADNPVSTWAAALTLSSALNIIRFRIINGSAITLTGNSDNYTLIGSNWTLALAGQSIAGIHVSGATITGIGTGAGYDFHDCTIGTCTLADGDMFFCGLAGDLTISAAGTYYMDQCFSGVAGTATPSIDFGSAVGSTNLNVRHYSGGVEVKEMGATGTDKMSLEGDGQLVINASSVGGTIAIRGNFGPITGADAFLAAGGSIVDTGNISSIKGKTAGAAGYDRTNESLEALQDLGVSANVVAVNGNTTNDGVSWYNFFKKMQACIFGKAIRSGGNFKYRDQADSSDLVDYDVSATGRDIN